jgi:uncharacterized cupredoxin-like copper-binding protein
MKTGRTRGAWRAHWGFLSLAAMASLSWLSAERSMALDTMPAQEPRIEIAIRNSTYMRTKTVPIRAEMPMVLVVRNEDPIPHGFISPMFSGLQVTVEAGGIEVFGRDIEGVHVAPGQTAVIRLTAGRQGKMSFRCDLHPNVEGELYLLDVPVG